MRKSITVNSVHRYESRIEHFRGTRFNARKCETRENRRRVERSDSQVLRMRTSSTRIERRAGERVSTRICARRGSHRGAALYLQWMLELEELSLEGVESDCDGLEASDFCGCDGGRGSVRLRLRAGSSRLELLRQGGEGQREGQAVLLLLPLVAEPDAHDLLVDLQVVRDREQPRRNGTRVEQELLLQSHPDRRVDLRPPSPALQTRGAGQVQQVQVALPRPRLLCLFPFRLLLLLFGRIAGARCACCRDQSRHSRRCCSSCSGELLVRAI